MWCSVGTGKDVSIILWNSIKSSINIYSFIKQVKNMNEVLRLLRIAKGYKVSEVAEQLGKSQPFISAIESGKKKPSEELLKGYSNLFHIKVSSLEFFYKEKTEKQMEYEEVLLMILKKICAHKEKKNKTNNK